MDERVVPAAAVIGLLLLLLVLMYLGFRARQRRQSGIPHPLEVPTDTGARLIELDVLYVASTVLDQPLERIAVQGLGFRARASVAVFDRGVALGIAGEPDAWLPASDIAQVDRSTFVIDRVVERNGLVRITWRLGGDPIDSYLRVTNGPDQTALITAIRSIVTENAPVEQAYDDPDRPTDPERGERS